MMKKKQRLCKTMKAERKRLYVCSNNRIIIFVQIAKLNYFYELLSLLLCITIVTTIINAVHYYYYLANKECLIFLVALVDDVTITDC